MNVEVRPRPPRQETKLAIVDCDIHPGLSKPAAVELAPFLEARWVEHLKVYGSHHRHGMSPSLNHPRMGGNRLDARPPTGGGPGSSLEFMQKQLLDAYNIEVGILQPFIPDGISQRNLELGAALCSALNEWQVANWTSRDKRLRGSIIVPREHPEAAVREIEKWAGNPNFAQVWTLPRGIEPMGRMRYWPIYEACQRVGMPLGVHTGGVSGYPKTPGGHTSYYMEDHKSSGDGNQSVLASLVLEGVFERFPDFRLVLIEFGFSWAPALAWRLDKHWKRLRTEVPHLRMAPSEYIRRNVWFTTQPVDEPDDPMHLAETMDWIGWDRIMFSTDYPHWDQDDPRYAFPWQMTEAQKLSLFRENANRVYGFGLK